MTGRLRRWWDASVRRYDGPASLLVLALGFDAVAASDQYLDRQVFDRPWELPAYAALHACRVALLLAVLARPAVAARGLLPILLFLLANVLVAAETVDAAVTNRFWVTVLAGLAAAAAVYLSTAALAVHLAASTCLVFALMRGTGVTPVIGAGETAYAVVASLLPALLVRWHRIRLNAERARAEQLASLDHLTGLPNRRGLAARSAEVVARARREDLEVAVLVADLDHFKQINDAHGHRAGDEVLRTVAAALADTVRPGDVVARTGGEEFAVLMALAPGAAGDIAERLRAAVAERTTPHRVTLSIGASSQPPPPPEDDADPWVADLMDRTDRLMYEAKRRGRDRVAVG